MQSFPESLPPEFGARVDAIRSSRGMSIFELSQASGLGESQIRKYIKGENTPSVDRAFALAVGLDVSLDLLVGDGLFK